MTGVDERVRRGAAVDLVAQLAHEDVDGPVRCRCLRPQILCISSSRDDAAFLPRERVQEPELGRGQVRALAVDVGLDLERVDAGSAISITVPRSCS